MTLRPRLKQQQQCREDCKFNLREDNMITELTIEKSAYEALAEGTKGAKSAAIEYRRLPETTQIGTPSPCDRRTGGDRPERRAGRGNSAATAARATTGGRDGHRSRRSAAGHRGDRPTDGCQCRAVLPGNSFPLLEASIYARTTGYLKSRRMDIGDRVREGQLLAEIAAPDVDAQLAQAKANLTWPGPTCRWQRPMPNWPRSPWTVT